MTICAENCLIYKADVAAEFLQLFTRLQPMDLDRRIETSAQNLLSIARESDRGDALTVSALKASHALTSRNFPNFNFSVFFPSFQNTSHFKYQTDQKLVPWAPVTNISESLEKLIVRTAVSIIIKLSCA